MLIKIQTYRDSNDWEIIENVKDVKYSNEPYYFCDMESLDSRHSHISEKEGLIIYKMHRRLRDLISESKLNIQVNLDDSPFDFETESMKLNLIQFSIENPERQNYAVYFDGKAYLCNDEGRTIHKFAESGSYTRAPSLIRVMSGLR